MTGLYTAIFFWSSLYDCKDFGKQAGQLFCSTFTGTSNKTMFHWRFMQLGGPIKIRQSLVIVRQFNTKGLHESIMGIDNVFR